MDIKDLAGISDPITKLIEVVSRGIGNIAQPRLTVRQAKADAQATIILAKADQEVAELAARTKERITYREHKRQENIEAIVSKATDALPSSVSAEPVDPDWTSQFFEACQDVHSDEMQSLWAQILAGEVSSPRTYSKRTLQFLKTLDKEEAHFLSELCGFAFQIEDGWRFLFECAALQKALSDIRNVDYIGHLAAIGLLEPTEMAPGTTAFVNLNARYFEDQLTINRVSGPSQFFEMPAPVRVRRFTQVGQQLAGLTAATSSPSYLAAVIAEHPQLSFSRTERSSKTENK